MYRPCAAAVSAGTPSQKTLAFATDEPRSPLGEGAGYGGTIKSVAIGPLKNA